MKIQMGLAMVLTVGLGIAAGDVVVSTTKPATTQAGTRSSGTAPATKPVTTTKAAAVAQDGPGMYKISAGPGGRFTTTVRAKSREDAIDIGLKTVGQKAMDYDENVNLNEMKVERVGP